MLVSGKQLLKNAYKYNYAVPAFNFTNMENLKSIISRAEKLKSPVFIQTTQGAINYAGFNYLADLGMGAAKRASVPVALHLDHGKDFDYIVKAIRLGWTSLMFDASHYDIKKNSNMVNEVIKIAKPINVSVEAEVGIIGGKEDDLEVSDRIYTEVDTAKSFYKITKCDSLAIAVGTVHGIYKKGVNINFQRIKDIKEELKIPLVLHGSSGVPLDMVKKAVMSGINKVNFDTDLKVSNLKALKLFINENPNVYDIRKMYKPGIEAMEKTVEQKIHACMSENKSWI